MDYYTFLFTCLPFIPICDSTLLWRINVNPPAYLLGTAHLPHTYLWPSLSDTAKSAFDNSTNFLPEFDMTNFFSFTRFRMCMNSHLLAGANAPPPPGKFGEDPSILDIYLTSQARLLKKTVTSLETVDTYCEFTKFQIDSLTTSLTSNINKPPKPNGNVFEQMRHLYNCDLNYPGEVFPPPLSMDIPDHTLLALHQRLAEILERRDTNMAQTIDNLLKERSTDKRFFFAVGYIHLMGADGIITKLKRDYNYSVTRLCTDPPDFRVSLRCQASSWCDHIGGL